MRDCRCGTSRQVEEREGWLRRTVMCHYWYSP